MDTNLLTSLFIKFQFDYDDREPVFFFTIKSIGTFGFVSLELFFWLETFVLLSLQSLVNALVAVIVYQYIVVPRRRDENSISHFILGYGVICPLLVLGPLHIFSNELQVSNVTIMLCCGGAFFVLAFRVNEAMHGLLPDFAESNMKNFVLYCGVTLHFQFDPKTQQPVPLTLETFLSRLKSFLSVLLQASLMYSLLLPLDYKVAPQREIQCFFDLFYWGNLVNAYLMASLTSLLLDSGASGLGLLQSVGTGYAMEPFSDSPLTKSTSPSDFWGRRWDRPVQSALSRGVFRPLRKAGYSRHCAAMGTFIMSGVLHEYVQHITSLRHYPTDSVPNNPLREPYQPAYGSHFLFFIWNGLLLLLERVLQGNVVLEWMATNLPRPVRTMLVLLMVLPVAHLFTDECVRSCFYSDAAFGFPKIVYLGGSSSTTP